jgi:uncharacterized membrane protein YsdA (DUF1294 family)
VYSFKFGAKKLNGRVVMKYIIFYGLVINVIAFIIMYYDKHMAVKHKSRVPEKRLFLLAAIFGSVGIWGGMYLFRHKTKHMKFVLGVPLILIIQIFIIYKLK